MAKETEFAIIRFTQDWSAIIEGELRAGSSFAIEYDTRRLPRCRATYNGLPAWGIAVWIRVLPGGDIIEGGWSGGQEQPDSTLPPLLFRVPQNAKSLEIWFKGSDQSGCVEWDSRFGANYRFEVDQSADSI